MAKNKRILLCDDDPDIVEVTRIILEMEGFLVETLDYLGNAKTFVRQVSSLQPDLILMDLRMPDIGGEKATQILKMARSTQHIPIIIFSANDTISSITRRIKADGAVRKPFDINQLMKVVNTHI